MKLGTKVKAKSEIDFGNYMLPKGSRGKVVDVWGDGRITVQFAAKMIDSDGTSTDGAATVMDFQVSAIP